MMLLRRKHAISRADLCVFIIACVVWWQPQFVHAKQRLAFVVGVGDYQKASGMPTLKAPASDGVEIKAVLEQLHDRFQVDLVTNDQVKDKAAFQAAFEQFLGRIRPGDEVLFYFSGHGYSVPEKKNYYLLPSAKSRVAFLSGLTPDERRRLDTSEKTDRHYREWITDVALSEDEIEKSIADRKPSVIILIADACRSPVDGAKGASLDDGGIVLPNHSAFGTFRLYSAGAGQTALDSLEPISRPEEKSPSERGGKDEPRAKERTNSLFTKVLLSQIDKPGLEISVMAQQVKTIVRNQARKMGHEQIPDFNQDDRSTDFYFAPAESGAELSALCLTADAELAQLRYGVSSGSLGRDAIERKRADLSRCGSSIRDELRSLARIEAQGTGSFAAQSGPAMDTANLTDPQQICDIKGSSPLDPARPQGFAGIEIQKVALAAIAGEIDSKKAEAEIKSIVDACERAATSRPRIARLKFNAARGNYALATMSTGLERTISLRRASFYNAQAVELGYAAAYNNLALMIQNGEYYKDNADTPEPADRDKAASLLTRGAELNHVVAQYNLGLAYLQGDLGVRAGAKSGAAAEQTRDALAFRYLSAAAERTYVPSMVETAKLLHDGTGVPENPKRAVGLLEDAASHGSWEAMYWLGQIYRGGKVQDAQRAIVWYARAAEAGEVRSQEALAEMLTKGEGLPAPQLEAAGRYWRLASYTGSAVAQAKLGDLLREGKIPFRPMADRKPDGGALEIRNLYLAAFERGNPRAGLALAALYRTGFPKELGSDAIPKNPEHAVELLCKSINRVREAEPDSQEADPKTEALAAFELVNIYDSGEAKRRDGTSIISDDQIQQLRHDYGDGGNRGFIRVSAIGAVACGSGSPMENTWIMVWDWDRDMPPTEPQLRWLERFYKCREAETTRAKEANKREPSPENIGFTKAYRKKIAKQYKTARDEKKKGVAKAKSFYERMAELVTKADESRSQRKQ